MTIEASKQFGKDVNTMLTNFERFQDYDFINWLTNAVGTPFENDGFEQKTDYYSLDLKNDLLKIYNG